MPLSAEDRFAIQDLMYLYGHFLDSKQTHRVAKEVFASDAAIDYGTGPLVGRDAIAAFFASFEHVYDTAHLFTNLLIQGEGNSARCQGHTLAFHWKMRSDAQGRPSLHSTDILAVGGYQDELRRGPDGWRIIRRKILQYGTGVGAGAIDDAIRPVLEGGLGRLPDWP